MHLWIFQAAFVFILIGRSPTRRTAGSEWLGLGGVLLISPYTAQPYTPNRMFGVARLSCHGFRATKAY